MKRTTRRGQPPAPPKKKRAAAGRTVRAQRGSNQGSVKAATLAKSAKAPTRAAKQPAKTTPAGARKVLDVVRLALEDYAKRGVFSGFSESSGSDGQTVFSFVWLHDQPMLLTLDPTKRSLRYERMLPGVKPGSEFAGDLKRMLLGLKGSDVPEYRRVDPKRAVLSSTNRQNHLTVTIAVKKDEYEYAVNRMVNVAHELFVYLRSAWPEYLMEYFNEPEE